jgi:ESCRT-II complex subunit VPS36
MHLSAGTGTNKVSNLSSSTQETENLFEGWECEVCGNRNPPGLSPTAARICTLCGVPRSSVPIPIKTPAAAAAAIYSPSNQGHLSSSLPASVLPSASSSSTFLSTHPLPPSTISTRPTLQTRTPSAIACPACTFLNHPSMRSCEMCSTPLPRLAFTQTQSQTENTLMPTLISTKSAPSSRPVSPDLGEDDDSRSGGDPTKHMIKLSFRKGGDKAFYAVLKRSLMGKAWEVCVVFGSPFENVLCL